MKNIYLILLCLMFGFYAGAQCPAGQTEITIEIYPISFGNEIGWELIDQTTSTVIACQPSGTYATGPGPVVEGPFCVTDGNTIVFAGYDTFGDDWNGGYFNVIITEDGSVNGCAAQDGCVVIQNGGENIDVEPDVSVTNSCETSNEEFVIALPVFACDATPINGCTDPAANNFNVCASVDDGSCLFPVTNDDCADAIDLGMVMGNVCPGGTTTGAINFPGATAGLDALLPTCDVTGVNLDVFYQFTAPATGQIQVNVLSGADVEGTVYTDCPLNGGLEQPGCFNNTSAGGSQIISGLTPGTTYILQLWQDDFSANPAEVCLNEPCLSPTVTATAVCQIGDEANFYVEVNVTDFGMGNTAYTVDIAGPQANITAAGITTYGPFPSGVPVDVVLTGVDDATCGFTLTGLDMMCVCDPLSVDAVADGVVCPGDPFTLDATLNEVIPGGFIDYTVTTAAPGSCTAVPDNPADCVDLALGDDAGSGPIPLGFNFDFFGVTYTDVCVGSNGYVTFTCVDETDLSEDPIPTPGDPDGIIALFWDDLNPTDAASGPICTYPATIGGQTCFVVDYQGVAHFGGGETVTGQIIICPDGSITINCIDCQSDGGTDTAGQGIEDETGSTGFFDPAFPAGTVPAAATTMNCVTFTPNVNPPAACDFVAWVTDINDIPGTTVSTTNPANVNPTMTTSYFAVVDCNGVPCFDEVVVTMDDPANCLNACPTSDFSPPFAAEFICDGETLTQVPMAGNQFNIFDPDGTQLGGMMWFAGPDPTVDPPADPTAPVAHSGADLCAADAEITFYAFVQCDADLDGVFDLAAGDQWIQVALHVFQVYPAAQMPMIIRDDEVCNYTLTPACPNDVLTPATIPPAAPGEDPAPVSVNVTNEFGCMADFMVDPEMCSDAPPSCSLMAPACNACPDPACDISTMIDLTTGVVFNDSQEFSGGTGAAPVPPTYDNATNTGTLTLPMGGDQIFTAAGVSGLTLPDGVTEVCLTADINVISGEIPFVFEFRIEDGMGGQLQFNATVDGTGMCSIGGNLADGVVAGGFSFTPGASYTIAAAIADFDGIPVTEDIVVEISNIMLTVCAPDPAIAGCTDPAADNFDPNAQCDDGTCMFADPPCSLMAPACNACSACETSNVLDIAAQNPLNDAGTFGGGPPPTFPDFDPATNMGTLTILNGSVDAFVVSGLDAIVLTDVPTELCLTLDINVISGQVPFTIEFRIENGTGAPGNGGEALVFDAVIDGSGMCSIGGNFANGTLTNDNGNGVFDYNLGSTTIAVALAWFGQGPLPEDQIVEISNLQFSYCTPAASLAAPAAPMVMDAACPDGMNLEPGSIDYAATMCPDGSTIEYSLDGGTTWLPAAPTYDDVVAANGTLDVRCLCDNGLASDVASVATNPGVCSPLCQGVDILAGLPVIPAGACSGATTQICLTLVDAAEGLVVMGTIDGAPVTLNGAASGNPNELCVDLTAPLNETCDAVDVVIQVDAIQCTNGEDYPGILGGATLVDDLTANGLNPINVPVYPTLTVNTMGDGTCDIITAELVATDGTVCATAAGSPFMCANDGETFDYDFTGDITFAPPAELDCQPPPLTGTLTCNGCGCMSAASTISTTDPTRICIDGIGDPINVTIDVDGGGVGTWVVTDAAGIILALPPNPPFDLDGAGAGQCLIWYVNADDATFMPMVGDDAAAAVAAFGCAFLSNPITVDRIEVAPATISSPDGASIIICAVDGVDEPIDVIIDDAGIGANGAWVITDAAGTILALPPGPPFVLDGAGVGQCLIWWVNFDDPNFAPAVGDDALAIVAAATCAVLSNSIEVIRQDNCGTCEEEISYVVSLDDCDFTGTTIELFDAAGTSLGTMPLAQNGGIGTFGILPCGDYSFVINGAPPCYIDAGGDVGPRAFSTDGNNDTVINFNPLQIPTLSQWGLMVLALLLMSFGAIKIGLPSVSLSRKETIK